MCVCVRVCKSVSLYIFTVWVSQTGIGCQHTSWSCTDCKAPILLELTQNLLLTCRKVNAGKTATVTVATPPTNRLRRHLSWWIVWETSAASTQNHIFKPCSLSAAVVWHVADSGMKRGRTGQLCVLWRRVRELTGQERPQIRSSVCPKGADVVWKVASCSCLYSDLIIH